VRYRCIECLVEVTRSSPTPTVKHALTVKPSFTHPIKNNVPRFRGAQLHFIHFFSFSCVYLFILLSYFIFITPLIAFSIPPPRSSSPWPDTRPFMANSHFLRLYYIIFFFFLFRVTRHKKDLIPVREYTPWFVTLGMSNNTVSDGNKTLPKRWHNKGSVTRSHIHFHFCCSQCLLSILISSPWIKW
jgi:hypothetical protein